MTPETTEENNGIVITSLKQTLLVGAIIGIPTLVSTILNCNSLSGNILIACIITIPILIKAIN